MKRFRDELQKFIDMIHDGKPVALSRFADGELAILENRRIYTREFSHNINQSKMRGMIYESITYRAAEYHVGIGCRCCMGNGHDKLAALSCQLQERLTYSNVFVNANHPAAVEFLTGMLGDATLICNPASERVARVQHDPSTDVRFIDVSRPVLVAAGPMAGWIVMKMHERNPEGQYLDIGSALDPLLGFGSTRGYHCGEGGSGKVCTWE